MGEVFISYSWDSPEHESLVLSFTDYLRTRGFDAKLDKMLSQEETAIDFTRMMHQAITGFKKVIIVLSKGYKEKAEQFAGGVGTEYNLILNDITDHPNKYILGSFVGRSRDIIPLGFVNREIVDLSDENEYEKLVGKLTDTRTYLFSDVSASKPQIDPKPIPPFSFKRPDIKKKIKNQADEKNSDISQKSSNNKGISLQAGRDIHVHNRVKWLNIFFVALFVIVCILIFIELKKDSTKTDKFTFVTGIVKSRITNKIIPGAFVTSDRDYHDTVRTTSNGTFELKVHDLPGREIRLSVWADGYLPRDEYHTLGTAIDIELDKK